MKRSSIKKTFLGIIIVLMFCYSLHVIYKKIYVNVSTETIMSVTLDDVIDCKSVVVRDEDTVTGENQKFLKYCVGNGERISKDDVIAKCFESQQDAVYSTEFDDVKNELESLQKDSLNDNSSRNVSFITKEINNEIRNLTSKYEYLDTYKNRKKIISLLNERQNILGNGDIFSKRIEYLKSRKSELEKMVNSQSQDVFSPYAGYFVSKVDGYEKVMSFESIEKLDYNDFVYEELLKRKSDEKGTIGKIIKSTRWYLICYVPAAETYNIQENMEVSTKFSSGNDYIPTKIEKIVKSNDGQNSIVILSCDYMDSKLCFTRFENVFIKKYSYFGFKIPKDALQMYEENGVICKGIYVKNGAGLVFKKIDIVYSGDNFVIAQSFNSEDESNEKTLTNGDMVVVRGKNLYDGKCVL